MEILIIFSFLAGCAFMRTVYFFLTFDKKIKLKPYRKPHSREDK